MVHIVLAISHRFYGSHRTYPPAPPTPKVPMKIERELMRGDGAGATHEFSFDFHGDLWCGGGWWIGPMGPIEPMGYGQHYVYHSISHRATGGSDDFGIS